jgi:hypothetical protein
MERMVAKSLCCYVATVRSRGGVREYRLVAGSLQEAFEIGKEVGGNDVIGVREEGVIHYGLEREELRRECSVDLPRLTKALDHLTSLAIRHTGGHLTIMRFTTNWKAMLGTPCMDGMSDFDLLASIPGAATLDGAVENAMDHKRKFECK